MKKSILINAIAVIFALQFISWAPAFAQDGVHSQNRMQNDVSGNLFALRWDEVGYARGKPPERDKRHRPDHHKRERDRRHHHRHHEKRRPVRHKVVGVAVERQKQAEKRVGTRRPDDQQQPRPDQYRGPVNE
ncbi:hypothetical protein [Desulfosarcina variabilis]|uniref:hypothetical protein n=1 Tax=Desulfosarcina variabilis TaxID=2300 RepID=UPI003AFB3A87